VNGEKSCSFVYSRTGEFLPEYIVMQVVTTIEYDSYNIVYSTSAKNFDRSLPIAERMVSSLRVGGLN